VARLLAYPVVKVVAGSNVVHYHRRSRGVMLLLLDSVLDLAVHLSHDATWAAHARAHVFAD